MDITYQVTEGEETKIGRIRIAGNTKTRDKVIRREFRQDEGDTFNSALLRRSYQRLMNLNFFENVEMTPDRRAGTNIMDMKVKVTERPTGQFSMGAGYSSFDKLTGTISISEGNFGGRGQLLKLSAQMGSRTKLYNLTFREPWLLDRQLGGRSPSTATRRSTTPTSSSQTACVWAWTRRSPSTCREASGTSSRRRTCSILPRRRRLS